jgi:hypothetical protein
MADRVSNRPVSRQPFLSRHRRDISLAERRHARVAASSPAERVERVVSCRLSTTDACRSTHEQHAMGNEHRSSPGGRTKSSSSSARVILVSCRQTMSASKLSSSSRRLRRPSRCSTARRPFTFHVNTRSRRLISDLACRSAHLPMSHSPKEPTIILLLDPNSLISNHIIPYL